MIRMEKIRLIRAIRVQKNKWYGGKICESVNQWNLWETKIIIRGEGYYRPPCNT